MTFVFEKVENRVKEKMLLTNILSFTHKILSPSKQPWFLRNLKYESFEKTGGKGEIAPFP